MSYIMYKKSDKVCDQSRDGTRTAQIGDSLFSFGGWTSDIPIDSGIKTPIPKTYNDIYKTKDLITWEKVGNAEWAGRHTFGLDRLSDKIFVYGSDAQNPIMDCWLSYDGVKWYKHSFKVPSFIPTQAILDILKENYEACKNLTDEDKARSAQETVNETYEDLIEIFTNNINITPMLNRSLYGSCSDGCYIYLIGGMDKTTNFRSAAHDVWLFDGNDWLFVSNGLAAFEKNLSGAACYFNGKLWIISGGTYGTYTGTQEVYSSDDFGANWRRENDIPFPGRQYHNTCVWDNKLWVIAGVGGEKKGNLNDIYSMDTDGIWWQFYDVPDEFLPRHASGVCVYNNKLVITNGNYHNDCWIIEKQL